MNLPSAPIKASVGADGQSIVDTRLHGHWLVLARMLWLAMFVLTLVVFCANFLVGNYDLVTTLLLVANISVWLAIALVLFWRKSSNRAILLISLTLVLTPGFLIPHYPGPLANDRVWWIPVDLLACLTGTTLSFWYTFPDGRFVPGFTRWLVLGWIVLSFLPLPLFGVAHLWNYWLSLLYALVRIAFYASLALALVYRYRRRATPLQRQQIKWVVFASAIFIGWVSLAEIAVFLVPAYFPALGIITQLYHHVAVITSLLSVLIPLSIGIALLRYRLWEIDRLINRTLVYGTLIAMLALVYLGCVVALQALVRGLTGQASGNPLVVVGSTLVIAALFNPLYKLLQKLIDRRFYRRKYDAAKIIEAFSATLRNEVDLSQLSEHLITVVQETIQPTHVSLWLRPPEDDDKQRVPWRANRPVSSEEE